MTDLHKKAELQAGSASAECIDTRTLASQQGKLQAACRKGEGSVGMLRSQNYCTRRHGRR